MHVRDCVHECIGITWHTTCGDVLDCLVRFRNNERRWAWGVQHRCVGYDPVNSVSQCYMAFSSTPCVLRSQPIDASVSSCSLAPFLAVLAGACWKETITASTRHDATGIDHTPFFARHLMN